MIWNKNKKAMFDIISKNNYYYLITFFKYKINVLKNKSPSKNHF